MAGKQEIWTYLQFATHRSLSVPLLLICSLHPSYLAVGTRDLLLALVQCQRVPGAGICPYGSCSWRSCSGRDRVPRSLSSSHLHRKEENCKAQPPSSSSSYSFISPRGIHQSPKSLKPPGRRYRNVRPENLRLIHLSLPSPSFPLLEPYLRAITKQEANNIFYSSPCAVSQGEANQPPLYPGCPVLPRIIDHTNTSLYPWGGFGHLALLLAASHKSSLWLPVTAAQGCQDKSHPKG